MTLPAAVIMGLAAQCAPSVAPATIAAIVQTESQGFEWAINVNGLGRKIVPTSREQAVALARHYIGKGHRSEEQTYELKSLMRLSYAVFCVKKKTNTKQI